MIIGAIGEGIIKRLPGSLQKAGDSIPDVRRRGERPVIPDYGRADVRVCRIFLFAPEPGRVPDGENAVSVFLQEVHKAGGVLQPGFLQGKRLQVYEGRDTASPGACGGRGFFTTQRSRIRRRNCAKTWIYRGLFQNRTAA
jgi:hypothetical protein